MKTRSKLTRLVAMALTLMMVIVMSVPQAFAAEATDAKWTGTSGLTIHASANRSYTIYQIFYGDYGNVTDSSGNTAASLSNLEWGASMNDANVSALLAKLKALDSVTISNGLTVPDTLKNAFSSWSDKTEMTPDDLSTALKNLSSNSEAMDAFAAILTDVIEADGTNTKSKTQSSSATTAQGRVDYNFADLHDGYYLALDTTDGDNLTGTATRSKAMVQVVGPTAYTTKEVSGPVIDKTTGEEELKAAAVEIGKSVPFNLSATVPDMSGYNKYYFIVSDKMGKGLTFNPNSLTVTITNKDDSSDVITLTNANSASSGETQTYTLDYHVVTSDDLTEDGGTTGTYKYSSLTSDDIGKTIITIVFNNMKQYQDYAGGVVSIDYSATVNEDFDSGNVSVVDNKAYVTYPNDPSEEYEGENEPTDNEKENGSVTTGSETGENNTVSLYTTKIVVNKTDSNGKRLTGASFQISGSGSAATQTVTETFTRVFDYTNATAPEGGFYYTTASGIYEQMTDPATGGAQTVTYVYELTGATAVGDSGWTMNQVSEDTSSNNLYYMKATAETTLSTTDVIKVSEYNAMSGEDKTAFGALKSGYAAYTMDTTSSTGTVSSGSTSPSTATGTNGQIIFENLGVTTYTITETNSPDGYELLDGNYMVAISFEAPSGTSTKATWTYTVSDPDGNTYTVKSTDSSTPNGSHLSIGSEGELIVQVVNESGASLPITGGIGTTIFYVVGGILVVGAGVLLIVKRRMSAEEN